ncbi:MAG TPA: ribonuclease Z, partial [Nitrososphaeraceae archaeon]|nr:ribonuclease Z [Nitrososphaeraceae archaeon]
YSKGITGPPRPGRKIGISGDTRPTLKLTNFFKNSDVLIYEATFLHKDIEKAKESFHSTAFEAALLAKNSNIKKLILTHFSARYRDIAPIESEARKIFENVYIANDLDVFIIPYTK